jgi:hypothetical protein
LLHALADEPLSEVSKENNSRRSKSIKIGPDLSISTLTAPAPPARAAPSA